VKAVLDLLAEVYPVPDPKLDMRKKMEVRRASKAWKAARALHDYAETCRREVADLRAIESR
jgi:hypothetical protein